MRVKTSSVPSVQWIFLAIMGAIYLIAAFVNFALFESMVSTFVRIFWKILPILPLIFGLIFLSNLFLDPKRIKKYLGVKAGFKGFLISVFGGILSTGPIICGILFSETSRKRV